MSAGRFWRGKRVFLTGHTGFKGTWACKLLEALGAEVTGYALKPEGETGLYNIAKPRVNSVTGDIRDFEKLYRAYRDFMPEVVIHMAAQPLVLPSYREPRYTYETNVMGTVNLLECIRLVTGARSVVNVTTDKVYLNLELARGYAEDEILCGHDPYSNSKSCSELVTYSYDKSFFAGSGTAVSTVRSGNVIGGGDFAEKRIIPDCARAAAAGDAIKLRNPSSVRPYQHVLDTLCGYLLLARRQWEAPELAGSYNIGPEPEDCVTSGRLAELFCAAWGEDARWEHVPENTPFESGLLTLDCAKIKRELNWRQRWGIEDAVKAAATWYSAYRDGEEAANAIMSRQIEEFLEAGDMYDDYPNRAARRVLNKAGA